jgi:hypothetical protein
LKTGFRRGDFTDSLVIGNVAKRLAELRAVSREALVESINIIQISCVEKGQAQKKILKRDHTATLDRIRTIYLPINVPN